MRVTIVILGLTALFLPHLSGAGADTSLGKLPLYFIENQGQTDREMAYYVQGSDKTLFFGSRGMTFALTDTASDQGKRWAVKLDFSGACPEVKPRGEDKQKTTFNYFKGGPEEWRTGIPAYSRLVYGNLWPGIDLVYTGSTQRLKYEFLVKPGADPKRIRLTYRGVDNVSVTADGALSVAYPGGSFKDGVPVAYQVIEGERKEVSVEYSIGDSGRSYGFTLGSYDPNETLILDPVLYVYCGYIGGETGDLGNDIDVDNDGNVYITGNTWSTEAVFPVKAGPDLTANGCGMIEGDAFVAKVSADGTQLIYCGFIGGEDGDTGEAITVDRQGHAYVTGKTRSTEETFPVKTGPDLSHNGNSIVDDGSDAYVAKVKPDGTELVFCGYIGGLEKDRAFGIALDDMNNVYIAGATNSREDTFPVKIGPDLSFNGNPGYYHEDAFVAKVKADGTELDYCGYIGGMDDDFAFDIAVDGQGHAYITGATSSDETTFPVKIGPDLTYNSLHTIDNDAFVAKVKPDGTSLLYCGYLGGSFHDDGAAIAVDDHGCAYVAGTTNSREDTFPVKIGPDLSYNGNPGSYYEDAFVAKVAADGRSLAYCGFLGGEYPDFGYGIDVDRFGRAYIVGFTYSSEMESFPLKYGPDLSFNGVRDGFMARVDAEGKALDYCGYIGGDKNDFCLSIVVDDAESVHVVGYTCSTETTFPLKAGPYFKLNGGVAPGPDDAFVAKMVPSLRCDDYSLSTGTGGKVHFFLNAGEENKQRNYILLGSVSGSEPGTPLPGGKVILPLNWDSFTDVMIKLLNGPVFKDFMGSLDGQGCGEAEIDLSPVPAGAGLTLYFAYGLNNYWDFTSLPVVIKLLP
jgi:hypothetical protein